MRRDHFTIAAEGGDTMPAGKPTLDITYDGPTEPFERSFTDEDGHLYESDVVDAAFRLRDPPEDDDSTGVFSLTHRITGEYLLEANTDTEDILALVRTARDSDEERYRIRITGADESISYEMDGLFVYDEGGDLLEQHSLIPSGVEL